MSGGLGEERRYLLYWIKTICSVIKKHLKTLYQQKIRIEQKFIKYLGWDGTVFMFYLGRDGTVFMRYLSRDGTVYMYILGKCILGTYTLMLGFLDKTEKFR